MKRKETSKNSQQTRNQQDTIEIVTDKLRDSYMNYKDLAHRCIIDIKNPGMDL